MVPSVWTLSSASSSSGLTRSFEFAPIGVSVGSQTLIFASLKRSESVFSLSDKNLFPESCYFHSRKCVRDPKSLIPNLFEKSCFI